MVTARQPRPTEHPWRRVLARLLLGSFVTISFPVWAEPASQAALGRTAVARPAAEWDRDGRTVKIEFDFGDFKAWARRDGSWGAEGPVTHHALLCATYTLLLRVGHGDRACTEVQWFREPRPVASIKLCNNATSLLTGGNTAFQDASQFDEINCAERTISCRGHCK